MSYLFWSRFIFWSFVAAVIVFAVVTTVIVERIDRHQQQLADQHLRKRRIERYTCNRNR
jgi:heme exporter protein D